MDTHRDSISPHAGYSSTCRLRKNSLETGLLRTYIDEVEVQTLGHELLYMSERTGSQLNTNLLSFRLHVSAALKPQQRLPTA